VPRSYVRRVSVARINRREQLSLFEADDFRSALVAALDPSVETAWRNRTWRLSRPVESNGLLLGKLGFTRFADEQSVEYDEVIQDYVVEESPGMVKNFAQYVIDLSSQIMVFEQRPNDIKRESFAGAMGAILQTHGFTVDLLPDESSFNEWLGTIDILTSFKATIVPPNPSPRQRAEDINRVLLREPQSQQTSIELESDTGLDADTDAIEGAATHSADGHGRFRARALRNQAVTIFDSGRKILDFGMRFTAEDTEESLWAGLRDILEQAKRRREEALQSRGTQNSPGTHD
jgi:hypothetical protein